MWLHLYKASNIIKLIKIRSSMVTGENRKGDNGAVFVDGNGVSMRGGNLEMGDGDGWSTT